LFFPQCRHQKFQFPLWYAVHLETGSEHRVLNGSPIFVSFTWILLSFCSKFQYSLKRRQDEEGKQSDRAAIRDSVLTVCPTMHSIQQSKLKLLMPVLTVIIICKTAKAMDFSGSIDEQQQQQTTIKIINIIV